MNKHGYPFLLACLILLASTLPGNAQWITQTNALRAGWNAVFTHVDASHATLDELIGNDLANPIQEVWLWQAAPSTGQFIDSPQVPTSSSSEWASWSRSLGPSSALRRLAGNAAYLVRVDNSVSSYDWKVKGKPVTPTYKWTLTGLNFIGFPALPSGPPSFDSFLAPAPQLRQYPGLQIFHYQGGELNTMNPVVVVPSPPRTTALVRRDQAYWIRAGETYNQYFGPFQILQTDPKGIGFGDTRGLARFRLRNVANVPLTVTLRQVASETPPAGHPTIQGLPPLLLRGPINTTNLTFSYSNLDSSPQQWTLAAAGQPGSEVEVVIGLNRFQMSGSPGALFAGILRFTDSLGLSQVDLAVSGEKTGTTGLWVGGAAAAYVSHYLKPFAKTNINEDLPALLARLQLVQGLNGYRYEHDPNTGRVLVFGGPEQKTGSYLLDGPIKVDSGTVARPFPLRLIVHHDGATARLLQKVYHGIGLGSNAVLTTKESLLHPAHLGEGRRISAVHLPASAGNAPWNFSGAMQQGGTMSVTVPLSYDDQASNPFLHTYHPDHDNLNAQFDTPLARGLESFGVSRQITLTFTAPENDFDSLTGGSQDFSGNYAESVTFQARGSQTRQYHVLGTFSLKRISDLAALTTQ